MDEYWVSIEIMTLSTESTQPEPSFQLTGSEFKAVVEGLASNEQKLTSFEWLLDLEKDFTAGNDLPLMQRTENMLYHYQHLPDSSLEKLVSALYSIGLSLPAKTISHCPKSSEVFFVPDQSTWGTCNCHEMTLQKSDILV